MDKSFESLKRKSPEGYEAFTAAFQEGTCKKGEIIQHIGEVSRKLYILKSGVTKQFRYKDDGSEHIVWFNFKGDLMTAYRSFVTQEKSLEGIIAIEDCEYTWMARDTCYALAEKYHPVESFFREMLEFYYIASDERLFFLQALSAKQKYNYLLENMPHFLQRIPQKEISSFLGITRETFSRIRKYAAK